MRLKGTVELMDDVALKIRKGTTILADAGAALVFGDYDSNRVIAKGTKDEPIRFCGRENTPGFWFGIDARLEHRILR